MIIAQTQSEHGETILRQGSAGYELIVDGQFLMSSASGPSSEELVRLGLEELAAADDLTVLIGGLGLGFSLRTALAEPRVAAVRVVELEAALIDWHRRGLLPETAAWINDQRASIVHDDLLRFLARCEARYDLIALDIDNGPDWLSHAGNAGLYTPAMLSRVAALLNPGGIATFWSADRAPGLMQLLNEVFGNVAEIGRLDTNGAGKTIEAFIYRCRV
jgi:spermidine synthase